MIAIDFSNHIIDWFKSCLSKQLFRVNLENCYSDPTNITCGSFLGLLLFLIYVNDMSQAVKCSLVLHADDYYPVFQGKNVIEIEKQLKEFSQTSVYGFWITDTLDNIYFSEDRLNLYFLLVNLK